MVAGPEVSHLVADYEIASGTKEATKGSIHHERTMQAQRAFLDKVNRLTNVLHDMVILSKRNRVICSLWTPRT